MRRVIQNSFVAGEIGADLHGRSDTPQYKHGAARIENFAVGASGALRKRAGTQLVRSVRLANAAAWRVIPYLFNADRWGYLALYVKAGDAEGKLYARFFRDGGADTGEVDTAAVGWDAAGLKRLKHKQFGDTFFITCRSTRTLRCLVDFPAPSLAWSEMPQTVELPSPPALTATPGGFGSGSGWRATTIDYALFGVKGGVYSEPSLATANTSLPWADGASVLLNFSLEFSVFDHFVLAKKTAGRWAVIGTFHDDSQTAFQSHYVGFASGNAFADTSLTAPQNINGQMREPENFNKADSVLGMSPLLALKECWSLRNPNRFNSHILSSGRTLGSNDGTHSFVTMSNNLTFRTASAIKKANLWLGGVVMTPNLNPNAATLTHSNQWFRVEHSTNGSTWASVGNVGPVTPSATAGPLEIQIGAHTFTAQSRYRLTMSAASGGAALHYTIRGLEAFSEITGVIEDKNFESGVFIPGQDPLAVGDNGMDADICDTYEQRLVFASSAQRPFTAWFSVAGDLLNFYANRPQTMADAFEATIPATRASRILHSFSGDWLLLFTESGVYVCGAGQNGAFGFQTITLKRALAIGADPAVEPCEANKNAVFAGSDGRSLHTIRYDLQSDGLQGVDLTRFARGIFAERRITRLAWQSLPDPVVWCLLDDGTLAAATFNPEEQVLAWHRHHFATVEGMRLADIIAPGAVVEMPGCVTQSCVLLVWADEADPARVFVERFRNPVETDAPDAGMAECVDHAGYSAGDLPQGWDDVKRPVKARVRTLRPESPEMNLTGVVKNIHSCALRLHRSGAVKITPARGELAGQLARMENQEGGGEILPVEANGSVVLWSGDARALPLSCNNAAGELDIESADNWPCSILSAAFTLTFDSPEG